MRLRTVVAALATLLLCVTGAAAQGADPQTTARVRLGPIGISPTVTLRDLGVDTNVYNDSRSDPVKDFAFTLVPAFTATVGSSRAQLSIRSTTDLVYFARQRSERSVNQDLSGTVAFRLNRLSPYAEAGYLSTRQRVWQEIDARARHVQRRGSTGVGIRVTPKIGVDLRGELWRMAFDGDATFDDHELARELNREVRTFSGTLRYAVTPLTTVLASTEVAATRFVRDPLRDADSRRMHVGLDLHPRALVSGSVRIGYDRFRPSAGEVPDFNGLVGSAAVSYRLREATAFGFAFNRNIDFSYLREEPYFVHEAYGVSVRREISGRWDVEVSGERSRHQYRRAGGGRTVSSAGHSERVLTAGLTIGHDLGPRTRVATRLSYADRRSDFEERRYDGLRIGTSIAYGF